MFNKEFLILVLISVPVFALVSGCATTEPQRTPLEIQSMQTRSFEEPKAVVFPSVISVFQDLGYIVQTADIATGLITSESAADSNQWFRFWTGTTKVTQTRATAFVEEIRDHTSVRLNFVSVAETSGGWGQRDRKDSPILEPGAYQNAFERIENAIFLRSGN